MAVPKTVDEYIEACPPWAQDALRALRQSIREAAPTATETISYQMPTFKDGTGRLLVSYAAFTNHYSLFPLTGDSVAKLGDEAKEYAAGKGTMKFSKDAPLPVDLVKRLVALRLEENAAKGPQKR